MDGEAIGEAPLSVEADSLGFVVVPARAGSDIAVEAEGAALADEGEGRYTLSDMAETVTVRATVSDRLNAVRFTADEGAHALVDGQEATEAQAVNGALRFSVAADEGYEISNVTAENLEGAKLTGKGVDYILENVTGDGVVIHIAAAPEAPRTDFSYQDRRVIVTAVADEDAALPQSAEIKADYLAPGTKGYAEAEAAVREAYHLDDAVIVNLAPYDIYFMDGETRIEPEEGKVRVSIQFVRPVEIRLPESTPGAEAEEGDPGAAEASEPQVEVVQSGVLHQRQDGTDEKLDARVDADENGDIHGAEFTTEGFSVFTPFSAVLLGADGDGQGDGGDETPATPHSVTFSLTGTGEIRVNGQAVGEDPLPVEGDSLDFTVVPANKGSDIDVKVDGATLADKGNKSGTPVPRFEGMSDEEMEGLLDIFGYGTPLYAMLGTGDTVPAWVWAYGCCGLLALALVILLGKRKRRTN